MKNFKHMRADVQIWFLNHWFLFKKLVRELIQELKVPESSDVRLFCFVVAYLFLSIFGLYNLAHLVAFVYIIKCLEKRNETNQ
jgi:hypothetical protein